MKIGTLFKKTASLIAAGLLSLSCIGPIRLLATDTANNDTVSRILQIYIDYVTNESEYETLEYTFFDPSEYVTLKELGISLPEYTSPAPGVAQTGWSASVGNPFSEDTEFSTYNEYSRTTSIYISADYDKEYVIGYFTYINSDGIVVNDIDVGFYDEGTTFGEANAYFQQYLPDDMTTEYTFNGWDPFASDPGDDEVIGTSYTYSLHYYAQYKEGLMVEVNKYYIGETGMDDAIESSVIVPAGTTYEDIFNDFLSQMTDADIPVSYPGLRFSKWDYHGYQITPTYEVQNGSFCYVKAFVKC